MADTVNVSSCGCLVELWESGGVRAIRYCPKHAAAPDMLEALKLLQAALTEYRLRDVKKRYSLCVADAAASNAIAKAEGAK